MKKRTLVFFVCLTLVIGMIPSVVLAIGSGAPNAAMAEAILLEYNYQKDILGFNPGKTYGDGRVMNWSDEGMSRVCQWFVEGDSTATVFSKQGPWFAAMGGMMGAFETVRLAVIFVMPDGQGGYVGYTVKNEAQDTAWGMHENPQLHKGLAALGAPTSNQFWALDEDENSFLAQNFELGSIYVYYDENGNIISTDKQRGVWFEPDPDRADPPKPQPTDPNEGQDDPENIPPPIVWYKFNETSGTTATDSSGNQKDATLVNGPVWVTGKIDNGVKLEGGTPTGSKQHIATPNGIVSGVNDFTIATWVKVTNPFDWTRIFDFGTGQDANMYLVTSTDKWPEDSGSMWNKAIRFSITTNGLSGEQHIVGPANSGLPVNEWVHVAVALKGNVGSIYINGERLAQNRFITIKPSALGNTTKNWIGKAQYDHDNYLGAEVDDFRIYDAGLNRHSVRVIGGFTEQSEIKYGDVNGDENVTNVDLILLKRHISGIEVSPFNFQAADVNADGQVTNVDIILLQRYLAGVLTKLGPQ